MRKLVLNDNELYLDGKQLRYLTEFSIEFEALKDNTVNYCWLKAKGILVKNGRAETDDFGGWCYYEIDEQVKLENLIN